MKDRMPLRAVGAMPFVLLLVVASAGAARAQTGPAGATLTAEIRRWIPALGAGDTAERERAAAALVKIGAPAIPFLEAELERLAAPAERVRAVIAQIRPGPKGAVAAAHDKWYEVKFREGARRVDRGDYLGAVKLLDAILVLEPDCPIRDRIQSLRLRAKELHLRTTVVEARLVPKRVLLKPGAPIELTIEVKNVSGEPLALAAPDVAQGELFGALEVETLDAAATGERTRSREVQRVGAAIEGALPPGETLRTTATVKSDRPLARSAFRRVTISGAVRSQVLQRGDERFDRFLPMFPVEVFIVDPVHHAIAADPLAALGEAVEALRKAKSDGAADAAFDGLSERVFFAALLAPAQSRDRAIDALATTLEKDGDPAASAAMAALAALADPPASFDRSAWREWIRRRAN